MNRSVSIGTAAGLLLAVVVITAGAAHAAASAIPVSGKEFSFKLGTRSVGRPGKVTFTFRNTGHVQHDFKIDVSGRR
jgi:hypothetical protein